MQKEIFDEGEVSLDILTLWRENEQNMAMLWDTAGPIYINGNNTSATKLYLITRP